MHVATMSLLHCIRGIVTACAITRVQDAVYAGADEVVKQMQENPDEYYSQNPEEETEQA